MYCSSDTSAVVWDYDRSPPGYIQYRRAAHALDAMTLPPVVGLTRPRGGTVMCGGQCRRPRCSWRFPARACNAPDTVLVLVGNVHVPLVDGETEQLAA